MDFKKIYENKTSLKEDLNGIKVSVKIAFYGRDEEEVQAIVEATNDIYETHFFSHSLGNKIEVESSTLFTSVAQLEDILEEFLEQGASEIRFIKA